MTGTDRARHAVNSSFSPALAAIGWYAYAPLLRASSRARMGMAEIPGRHALERARQFRVDAPGFPDGAFSRLWSREGTSVGDATAVRQWVMAERARALAESHYPQAAAYGRAEAMSTSFHDVEAMAGRQALAAIEAGTDATEALARACATWQRHCESLG